MKPSIMKVILTRLTNAFYKTRLGLWWDDQLLRIRMYQVNRHFPYGSQAWKDATVSVYIRSRRGRAKLAAAMINPLRTRLEDRMTDS